MSNKKHKHNKHRHKKHIEEKHEKIVPVVHHDQTKIETQVFKILCILGLTIALGWLVNAIFKEFHHQPIIINDVVDKHPDCPVWDVLGNKCIEIDFPPVVTPPEPEPVPVNPKVEPVQPVTPNHHHRHHHKKVIDNCTIPGYNSEGKLVLIPNPDCSQYYKDCTVEEDGRLICSELK